MLVTGLAAAATHSSRPHETHLESLPGESESIDGRDNMKSWLIGPLC